MIFKPNTRSETTGVYAIINGVITAITAMYEGGPNGLFWQSVRSCYGKGYWIEDKPWLDNDTWKDNR